MYHAKKARMPISAGHTYREVPKNCKCNRENLKRLFSQMFIIYFCLFISFIFLAGCLAFLYGEWYPPTQATHLPTSELSCERDTHTASPSPLLPPPPSHPPPLPSPSHPGIPDMGHPSLFLFLSFSLSPSAWFLWRPTALCNLALAKKTIFKT